MNQTTRFEFQNMSKKQQSHKIVHKQISLQEKRKKEREREKKKKRRSWWNSGIKPKINTNGKRELEFKRKLKKWKQYQERRKLLWGNGKPTERPKRVINGRRWEARSSIEEDWVLDRQRKAAAKRHIQWGKEKISWGGGKWWVRKLGFSSSDWGGAFQRPTKIYSSIFVKLQYYL